MTRPTIDQIRQLSDFATTYNWDLSFVKFPAVGNYPSSNDLNLRCVSTDIPKMNGQSSEIAIRGHKIKQPGIYTYEGTLTLTFVETVDNLVTDFFKQWREACWESKTGKAAKKLDSEATIRIARLNRQDEEIYEYVLTGCFIESYDSGGQLSDQGGDTLKPSITISYDYFIDTKIG